VKVLYPVILQISNLLRMVIL